MVTKGNDILMIRGDSESILVSCYDYLFEDGDIVELTVRSQPSSPEILHKTVTEFDELGMALFKIEPDDTRYVLPGNYKYDVSLTQADGTVTTVIPASYFTIKGDITYHGQFV